MKSANRYIHNVGTSMQTLAKIPLVTVNGQALPASRYEIHSYVEHLLKPSQRDACERATD